MRPGGDFGWSVTVKLLLQTEDESDTYSERILLVGRIAYGGQLVQDLAGLAWTKIGGLWNPLQPHQSCFRMPAVLRVLDVGFLQYYHVLRVYECQPMMVFPWVAYGLL